MSGVVVLIFRFVLAICLYLFLVLALFITWKELMVHGVNLSNRKPERLHVTIQSIGRETSYHVFDQTDVSIGRESDCPIVLLDEAVSARHARLSYHHRHWWVEDLGSTNGTWLNQTLVNTSTVLTTGDQIECGHTAIIVSIGTIPNPMPTKRKNRGNA